MLSYFVVCILLKTTLASPTEEDEYINPNLDHVKGLVCYQCQAYSYNLTPYCDSAYFKLTRPHIRVTLLMQCPYYQGSFCFKKVIEEDLSVETIRGCSDPTDADGYQMRAGCMKNKIRYKTITYCLCDTNKCNLGSNLSQEYKVILLFVTLLIGNNY